MISVRVPLGERSYDVLVGHGARHELAGLLPSSARRAAIVTQDGIPLDVDPGMPTEVFTIGHGEDHKTLATVETTVPRLRPRSVSPATTSSSASVAAWSPTSPASPPRRGIVACRSCTCPPRWSAWSTRRSAARRVSTSPRRRHMAADAVSGKNLVGAYWQPSGVVCDLDALATLPPREMRCGRGEMAKYHFLTGDDLLAMDEVERIARCVADQGRDRVR